LADILLARSAEDIFWLARYVERAENLARILDVNASFARDRRGAQDWLPVLQLHADEARFAEEHGPPDAEAVLRFYVTDRSNPSSIVSAVAAAWENARALRPLISTEMWAQLNVFHRWLGELDAAEALAPAGLARLLGRIKEACQAQVGITEGTLHRDQASYFHRLGRFVERADQTTRLLDIKYHALLPRPTDVGTPVDVTQWDVVLRSAAAHHAYLRVVPGGVTPAGVAGFLLLHPRFPRSVAYCVCEADRMLGLLRAREGLAGGVVAQELGALLASLRALTIERVIADGLHEFLDGMQRRLIEATGDIAAAYFRGAAPPAQAQRQG
jgi:uncharacterized alpha-E superfamily protein